MGPLVAGEEQWTVRAGVIVALCFVLNMLDGMDILVLAYVAPALGKALGPLTTVWTSLDGRSFRLLFARVPVPAGSLAGPSVRGLLVVLAYELTQTRQAIKNELQILVVTLLVGALLSGLFGCGSRGASSPDR